ncbi:MAG: acyltransferase family protein [Actinomycetaceae bacterium]|nr:acyltransferase family protein [Actinomycetaceae bacterium]
MNEENMSDKPLSQGGGSKYKKRFDWLDISKGIAILAVIFGHTLENDSFGRAIFYSFHMPLFFILAGFTFRVKPRKDVIKSTFFTLGLPYILMAFLGMVRNFLGGSWYEELSVWHLIKEYVLFFFNPIASASIAQKWGIMSEAHIWMGKMFTPHNYAYGIIWFILVLSFARVFLNEIMMQLEKFSFSSLRAKMFFYTGSALIFLFAGIKFVPVFRFVFPFELDLVLIATGYMLLGYVAKNVHLVETLLKRWYVIPLFFLAWYVLLIRGVRLDMGVRHFSSPVLSLVLSLVSSIVILALSTVVEKIGSLPILAWVKSFFVWAGKNSLLIYFVHSLDGVVAWFHIFVFDELTNHPMYYVAVARVVYVVIFSYVLYRAARRI